MCKASITGKVEPRRAYSGGDAPTGSAGAGRVAILIVASGLLGGCAMAMPSLWERTNTTPPAPAPTAAAVTPAPAADPITTGSIRRADGAFPSPIAEADWPAARRALDEALADRADAPSIPWSNAESGTSGTVTALQRTTGTDGRVCRAFLGSAIGRGQERWFDGRACRHGSIWAITEVKPWSRR